MVGGDRTSGVEHKPYPKGIVVSVEGMASLNITRSRSSRVAAIYSRAGQQVHDPLDRGDGRVDHS
jgi:hypothetical protein